MVLVESSGGEIAFKGIEAIGKNHFLHVLGLKSLPPPLLIVSQGLLLQAVHIPWQVIPSIFKPLTSIHSMLPL